LQFTTLILTFLALLPIYSTAAEIQPDEDLSDWEYFEELEKNIKP